VSVEDGAMTVPLSVLDLSPVPTGATASEALRRSVELARRCETLGYARYWVAEHHNTPGLTSSAPEILVAHIAAVTDRIRVGPGGIMLPNHAPLRIAESFRVLEALHPGRIDLGIGRAPGTDQITAFALRRSQEAMGADLPQLMAEMLAYVEGGLPDDHPFSRVRAMPTDAPLPPIWILGTSEQSAQLAAELGTGYAFAHYLGPRRAASAMRRYRESFRPSAAFPEPRAILGLSAICAETAERAEHLSWSQVLSVVMMRSGRPGELPTPEEGLAYDYSPSQREQVEKIRRAQVLGDPTGIAQRIGELVEECAADEVVVMTNVHDHGERVRSYELLADAVRPAARRAPAGTAGPARRA
jgi:luciferase family oxidoreductase group 1